MKLPSERVESVIKKTIKIKGWICLIDHETLLQERWLPIDSSREHAKQSETTSYSQSLV